TLALFELTFLTAGPDSQTLVVALYYSVFAAGVRATQSVDAMAVVDMVTTLFWLFIALRFVDPTQLAPRVREQRAARWSFVHAPRLHGSHHRRHQETAPQVQRRHALDAALQARPPTDRDEWRQAAQSGAGTHGGRGLHRALHSRARGSRPCRRVRGPRASPAEGDRDGAARARAGLRLPRRRARRLGRLHPADAAQGAARRRFRLRRWFARFAGDRGARLPRLFRRSRAHAQLGAPPRRRHEP